MREVTTLEDFADAIFRLVTDLYRHEIASTSCRPVLESMLVSIASSMLALAHHRLDRMASRVEIAGSSHLDYLVVVHVDLVRLCCGSSLCSHSHPSQPLQRRFPRPTIIRREIPLFHPPSLTQTLSYHKGAIHKRE